MIDEHQYRDLKARNAAYKEWAKQYQKKNGWTVIPDGVVPPDSAFITNDQRSAIEVYEFCHDVPDRYFLYIDEKHNNATTWTGDVLGAVTFGRAYRDNFGGERVPVTIKAINGHTYHGTYYASSGNYARVKLAKH